MNDLRVPGVLWVILLVFGVALVREYVPEPFYVDLAVVLVLAVLKYMNLGTKELEELLDIIDLLRQRAPDAAEPKALSSYAQAKEQVERPNRIARWLIG